MNTVGSIIMGIEERGEFDRYMAGFGSLEEAQDKRHEYKRDEATSLCLLCGMARAYGMHA